MGWLEPEDPAVAGGFANRPPVTTPGRGETQPAGHRRCRATGGASRTVSDVPGIVHGTETADRRAPAKGELVHVELAEKDCPGRAQAAHHLGILRRYTILE